MRRVVAPTALLLFVAVLVVWADSSSPPGPKAVTVSGSVALDGGYTTALQGAAASLSAPWSVQLSNGSLATGTSSTPLRVDTTGTTTQPISASALPLPLGASTSSNQTNGSQQTQIIQGGNVATVTATSALKTDGSAVIQPVIGTVTIDGGIATVLQGNPPWTTTVGNLAGGLVTLDGGITTVNQGAALAPSVATAPWLFQGFNRQTNQSPVIALNQSLQVESPRLIIGDDFSGSITTIDPMNWTTTLSGSATAVQGTGQMTLATGATANSTVTLTSNHVARFAPGLSNWCVLGIRLNDTGVSTNTRRWGCFDANDGYRFELSGTTFQLVTRKGAVDAAPIQNGSFNGNVGTTYTLDTNYHRYELSFVGSGVSFFVDGVLLHSLSSQINDTRSNTRNFHLRFENVNAGGGSSNEQISCRGTSILRLGELIAVARFVHLTSAGTTVLRQTPGMLHRVVVNGSGSGSASLTLYDNTSASGTVIAIISLTGANEGTFIYDLALDIGLTAVVTGASPGDVTIIYD
jgi:hypothetical protein